MSAQCNESMALSDAINLIWLQASLLREIAALKRYTQPNNPNCRSSNHVMMNVPIDLIERIDAALKAKEQGS